MQKKIFTAIYFIFLSAFAARAQVVIPPSLHCVRALNNGDVRLDWSNPVNNCGPFVSYNIYRSTAFNGPYALIHAEVNPGATFYIDPVGNGNAVTYYYFMNSDYTCGLPTPNSDTIDNLDPVPPVINYVTIQNNQVIFNWQPGVSPETFGYIIYLFVNNAYLPIDTVYGQNNTSYTDLANNPNNSALSYSVASIDSCFSTGPINTTAHHTIFVTQNTDRCNHFIALAWNGYDNWPNGVLKYDVYMSINGGAANLVNTFPANINADTITKFNDGDQLCLTVIATQNNGVFTSASNTICTTSNVVQLPNDFYVRNITVAAPRQIDVYYSMDPLADILNLEIERGTDGQTYNQIATIPPPSDLSMVNIYSDNTAYPDYQSFYYRIIAVDSCNEAFTSSHGKSLLLTGYAFGDFTNYLTWDSSIIDYSTVTAFNIYRDDGNGFSQISTVKGSTFTFQEPNGLLGDTACYYVEAIHSMRFPNGTIDQVASRSNTLCLKPPSQIYMPNAFAPEGKNNIFKPIVNVRNIATYSFSIFNRWGLKIFSTTNPDAAWDGRYNGELVQSGAYGYIVSIVNGNNQKVEKKGTVMVLR